MLCAVRMEIEDPDGTRGMYVVRDGLELGSYRGCEGDRSNWCSEAGECSHGLGGDRAGFRQSALLRYIINPSNGALMYSRAPNLFLVLFCTCPLPLHPFTPSLHFETQVTCIELG